MRSCNVVPGWTSVRLEILHPRSDTSKTWPSPSTRLTEVNELRKRTGKRGCRRWSIEEGRLSQSSALYIADRFQFRHFFCDSRTLHGFHHVGNILVGESGFFGQAGH